MDRQQFATLAIGIKSAYPASKMLEDKASMDFWYMMLSDIPYETAENAVMEHICTNIFPPNIAGIRKLCMERMKPHVLRFDEAWEVVQKAISKYGWQYPQQAFETMDELTLSVVKSLGWSQLCHSENPTSDRANFRETYEAKAEEQKNKSQMPEFVAKKKAYLQGKYIPETEEKERPQIEVSPQKVKIKLTEEQVAKREQMIEETKRIILGG